ncbi:glycosyltransferase [Arthrobacter sp. NicSoilB11]|uniref:glycosyltransferase n=1 Tax=Arthrobacter sp. NicSoilB11 TaxID=2830999 RepID=UPI001CC46EE0|nr:glycosyltransferase [Arthrobacter sp. NicSoilB11]BCW76820.1 hypothetical protein NicSoilB11_31450 [Arthrobacter sp. NicSoilB11]
MFSRDVQVLEVGGRGGVYQHSLEVARALAEAGYSVTLHTASDPEIEDERVRLCRCFSWKRKTRFFRGPLIAFGFLFLTVPHILKQSGTVWVQGTFKPLLTMYALGMLRLSNRRTIFSPHNLFTRYGGATERFYMQRCLRLAHIVVSYNDTDAEILESLQIKVARIPLFMYLPFVSEKTLTAWRKRLQHSSPDICVVGQLRLDKNLPMLVRAASAAGKSLVLMGEDAGALEEVEAEISRLPHNTTTVLEGFFPLEDLAAVVALTGAVALPYSVASQSGVAALAKAYDAKVIAYATGGLKEQADVLVGSLLDSDWEKVLREHALHTPHRDVRAPKPYSEAQIATLVSLFEEASR